MARSVPPVYPAPVNSAEATPPMRPRPAFQSARCAVAVAMPSPRPLLAADGVDQASTRDSWRIGQPPTAQAGRAASVRPLLDTPDDPPTIDPRAIDPDRAELQRQLADRALGQTNDHAFACMIASLCSGGGALPDWLGLEPVVFRRLLDFHFPGARLGDLPVVGRPLADARDDERAEVLALLLMDRAGESPSEVWMAHVVAVGCMASNHLWEDLGLWERATLTALMRDNFPALAARNVRDMKWKRFLYKQLCEAEGIYTCRAPSCEVCRDYHECFENGP